MAIDLLYPHPEYDFRATERWLEKKARRGWRMIPGGNLSYLAAFERAEPAEYRYRLVPTGNTGLTRESWGYDGYIVMPDSSQGAIYIDYADFHSELFAKLYAWELDHRTPNLIVHRGTEVYRIYTSVTIEDPESIFFPERRE